MHFLAHAASTLALLCSVINVDAAPTDNVTVAFTNQTVTDVDARVQPTCTKKWKFFPIVRLIYEIKIPNLPETDEVRPVCDKLWEQLNKWPLCKASRLLGCGEADNRTLQWRFDTLSFCNEAAVMGAFWAGTEKSKFGWLGSCESI